jgi:sugar (pentulose or hexulose) kinase
MNLLAIDAGTTHCKVGLFAADGTGLALASRPMAARPMPRLSPHAASGSACFDPEELWAAVAGAVAEATARSGKAREPGRAAAVGISSMAETGLLLDRRSGRPRTPFLPWFDTGAAAQAARIASQSDTAERFRRTGLHMSHKSGLAKLLWLRDELGVDLSGCTWLSVADYLAYRLTGQMATDPTLAARTHAFRLDLQVWDEEWLQHWDLGPGLFPPVLPSGAVTGRVAAGITGLAGLAAGTPVIIAGHDHVCAAFAAGATRPGWVMDSMGTAEVLLGAVEMPADRVEEQPLDRAQLDSGLLYGPHVVPGHRFWLGSLSLSGGAVEWLRGVLDRDRMSYGELEALIAGAGPQPTGILFFPHLAGKGLRAGRSGAAFLGLHLGHTRADLARAVLEGTAYEIERLRRAAEAAHGTPIQKLVAVGGGTRLASWLQVKADVSGVSIEVPPQREATLLGAALLAGLTAGLSQDTAAPWGGTAVERYTPNPERHGQYRELFDDQYLPLARATVSNYDV